MGNYKIHNLLFLLPVVLMCMGCNPEAKWEAKDVTVQMEINTVSAGFIECSFSTNKDAYYLIACHEPWKNFNPEYHQKQFMQLALDSAYADYLQWRNGLLRDQEENVAPFASHSLQYGNMRHFFTGLMFDTDYWVYAFAVNPETMKPIGKLEIINVTTELYSIFKDVRFEYRVDGYWDYIYPLDSLGNLNAHFPYLATIADSVSVRDSVNKWAFPGLDNPIAYFQFWAVKDIFTKGQKPKARYGVQVMENTGEESILAFQEGHTYYTAISGFDGESNQLAIYKFRWTKDYQHLFHDTDSTNLFRKYEDNPADSW